jgi:hypothetical protein
MVLIETFFTNNTNNQKGGLQMRDYIIIGIHGLLNKPPKDILEDWWLKAILEGLQRNHNENGMNPNFELAYWADVRNQDPVPIEELDERYEKARGHGPLKRFDVNNIDRARMIAQKWGGKFIDKGKDLIDLTPAVEVLLEVSLQDLGEYYRKQEIRQQIRMRLSEKLDQHKSKKILLIAHSMGSIIAYDVLRQNDSLVDFTIEHLITIGSPLGLPIVSKNIRDEFGDSRTPELVHQWSNIADPGDKVSIDFSLADEYNTNEKGIRVTDVLAHNEYVNHEGKENNHKSYGYLRAPELSENIFHF